MIHFHRFTLNEVPGGNLNHDIQEWLEKLEHVPNPGTTGKHVVLSAVNSSGNEVLVFAQDIEDLAEGLRGAPGLQGVPGPPGPVGPAAPPAGVFATKTTSQQVVNSAVLVDDAQLVLMLPADSRWVIMSMLIYEAHATPDVKFSLSGPAGSAGAWHLSPQQAAGGGFQGGDTHDLGQEQVAAGSGLGVRQSAMLVSHVTIGATAGALRIRWAQNTANVNPTTVHPFSYMLGMRVS